MRENTTGTGDKPPNTSKTPGAERDESGRWRKGQSGNKGGRPAELVEVREAARALGPAAIQTLAELMHSGDGPTRIAAAKALLDRAYGRVEQGIGVAITGTLAHEVEVNVRKAWPFSDGLSGDAVEASRRYAMMLSGEFEMPPSMDSIVGEATYRSVMLGDDSMPASVMEPAKAADIPPPPPRERPADPKPQATVDNITVLGENHAGEHRPIHDSRCPHCRRLANERHHAPAAAQSEATPAAEGEQPAVAAQVAPEAAADDARLRVMTPDDHVHVPVPDSRCAGCRAAWARS